MLITDSHVITNYTCIEPVRVHGVEGIIDLGTDFLTCYYRRIVARIENGCPVYERIPVTVLERPWALMSPGSLFIRWRETGKVLQ